MIWALTVAFVLKPVHGQNTGVHEAPTACQIHCHGTPPGTMLAVAAQVTSPALKPDSPAYQGITWPDSGKQASSQSDLDSALLYWINRRQNRVFSGTMRATDASFYPLVFGSVPAYWVAAWASDDIETSGALAFSGGWIATAGTTILLKRLIRRERPYVSRHDLVIRYTDSELAQLGAASSMPSGHSSMSVFAASFLATGAEPPVLRVAGGLWASSVVVSRMWNGVHYPSDVLAGSLLGSGMAFLARRLD